MPDDMQTSHLIIWPRDKLGSGSFLFDSKLFLTAEKVMVSIFNEEMSKFLTQKLTFQSGFK